MNNDRKIQTTMLIVDSKIIKNANMAEVKGYDSGKKKQYKTTFFQVEEDFS